MKNSAYNTIGTFFYFFCQWITTIIVARIAGFEASGVYAIAISFCNIFYFIANFGMRNFMLSDVENEFSFKEYASAQVLTIGSACVLMLVVLPFMNFELQIVLSCIIFMCFKVGESITIYNFGVLQLQDKFGILLFSFVLKGAFSVGAFALVLYVTQNIVLAILAMAISYFIVVFFVDVKTIGFFMAKPAINKKTAAILKTCLPLMLFSLILPYMNFITRYVVNTLFSTQTTGYYASVSVLTVVMTTLAGAIWQVLIPQYSKNYIGKQYGQTRKSILLVILGIFTVTLLGYLACVLVGDFVLSLLFGAEILPYSYLLIPTLFSASLLTLSAYFNIHFIVMRKNRLLLLVNFIPAVLCSILVYPLVVYVGMVGAIYSMIISMGVQAVLQMLVIFVSLNEKRVNR